MGQGDLMPAGRRRKKAIDPKKLKKIREGWEKADKIREKAHVHHEEHEVPVAEEELQKDLEEIENVIPKKPH